MISDPLQWLSELCGQVLDFPLFVNDGGESLRNDLGVSFSFPPFWLGSAFVFDMRACLFSMSTSDTPISADQERTAQAAVDPSHEAGHPWARNSTQRPTESSLQAG